MTETELVIKVTSQDKTVEVSFLEIGKSGLIVNHNRCTMPEHDQEIMEQAKDKAREWLTSLGLNVQPGNIVL